MTKDLDLKKDVVIRQYMTIRNTTNSPFKANVQKCEGPWGLSGFKHFPIESSLKTTFAVVLSIALSSYKSILLYSFPIKALFDFLYWQLDTKYYDRHEWWQGRAGTVMCAVDQ